MVDLHCFSVNFMFRLLLLLSLLEYAYKRCAEDGWWAEKLSSDAKTGRGWTNYSQCFTPETKLLLEMLYRDSDQEAVLKMKVAQGTRIMEMVGLVVSCSSLIVSLFIFRRFRCLRNNRTRIHQHLFVAILIQVLIRIVLYTDQYLTRGSAYGRSGIDNTPILCEAMYVFLEYARTAMFMWMFVEGHYLHNILTVAVFSWNRRHYLYYAISWGVPILMTAAWVAATAMFFTGTDCWWGYSFSTYFWILEGPRLSVILANLLFLLNIIRVLVTKLKESNSSEAQQVRKAVRAAIVLLPLLGITNILSMVHSPVDRSAWEFAVWSYVTTFLTSFQGFFIALIYCFLNGEVRSAFMKSWQTRVAGTFLLTGRGTIGASCLNTPLHLPDPKDMNTAFSPVICNE